MTRQLAFREIENCLYLDLGDDDLARAEGEMLKAICAGHIRIIGGHVLYYNGAADEDIYRDMHSKVC